MQIIFGIAIFIIVVTLILYKVNNRFEKKEFIILVIIIIMTSIAYTLYENKVLLISATLCAIAGAYLGNQLLKKVTLKFLQVFVAVLLLLVAIALGMGII